MKIKTFDSFTEQEKKDFYAELKLAKESSDPAAVNMWEDDWQEQKHTLPYKLEKTDMFKGNNGEFYIIYDGTNFVACGGVYRSLFSEHIALAGTRTWIQEDYRSKLIAKDLLLPEHKAWALKNNCKQVALCFNDYNRRLVTTWKRMRLGEKRTARTERNMFYDNFNELEFPVTIQYTKQWAIYEKLDIDWEFDWSTIQYEG